METAGELHPASVTITSSDWIYGTRYEPVATGEFEQAMALCPVDASEFTFVDIGCGKGKALLLASKMGFKHVFGVEWAKELAAIARKNVTSGKNLSSKATIVCGDATTWELPNEKLILFLNNPFEAPLLRRFVKNVEESLCNSPRDIRILYVAPNESQVFEESRFLRRVAEVKGEVQLFCSVNTLQ